MSGEIPSLIPAMAEIVLGLGAMALLMFGVFKGQDGFKQAVQIAIAILVVAGVVLFTHVGGERAVTFGGMFITDSFAIFTKLLVLIGSIVALLLAPAYLHLHKLAKFEFPVLVVLATLGMLIMISANNLMTLYVGLELQSLSLYVLAALNRDRGRSTEAGLKYFVLGALSSGMLLYGVSLVYGFSGSIDFDVLAQTIESGADINMGVLVGMVFIISGLCFKVSAVPFHMWTPDVYEGAPTPVTAFFASAPKVAALALFIRVVVGAFPQLVNEWQQVIVFVSIASMLIGAFVALAQTNIKRLMAYSSIGHIGFALVGLAAGSVGGIEALLVYITIYLTMTLGAFAAILSMKREGVMVEDINDLAGLSVHNLPMAIAIAIFMFSLAGIPLLAGFFGKWFIFKAAIDAGLVPLAVIGVLASVVGAFYYIRVIKIMFFDDPAPAFDNAQSRSISMVIGISAVLNSPVSFILISPLTVAAAWGASALIF